MSSRTLAGPLGLSLVGIAVVGFTLVTQVPSLLAAAFAPAASGTAAGATRLDTLVAEHGDDAALYADRWLGRSPFYPPPAPPPPRVDQAPDEPVQIEQRVHTQPGTPYTGPLTVANAIVGDEVWFVRGNEKIAIKIGETHQGVRVVRVNPPWSVTVAWTKPATATDKWPEGEYDLLVLPRFLMGPGTAMPFEPPNAPLDLEGSDAPPPDIDSGDDDEDPRRPPRRPTRENTRENADEDN
jgi:hypothetical protein